MESKTFLSLKSEFEKNNSIKNYLKIKLDPKEGELALSDFMHYAYEKDPNYLKYFLLTAKRDLDWGIFMRSNDPQKLSSLFEEIAKAEPNPQTFEQYAKKLNEFALIYKDPLNPSIAHDGRGMARHFKFSNYEEFLSYKELEGNISLWKEARAGGLNELADPGFFKYLKSKSLTKEPLIGVFLKELSKDCEKGDFSLLEFINEYSPETFSAGLHENKEYQKLVCSLYEKHSKENNAAFIDKLIKYESSNWGLSAFSDNSSAGDLLLKQNFNYDLNVSANSRVNTVSQIEFC